MRLQMLFLTCVTESLALLLYDEGFKFVDPCLDCFPIKAPPNVIQLHSVLTHKHHLNTSMASILDNSDHQASTNELLSCLSCLSSRGRQYSPHGGLSKEGTSERKFLEAISKSAVSKAKGEVYAAMIVKNKLLIAENHPIIPDETLKHLRNVFRWLQRVPTNGIEITREARRELGGMMSEFSHPKIIQRLNMHPDLNLRMDAATEDLKSQSVPKALDEWREMKALFDTFKSLSVAAATDQAGWEAIYLAAQDLRATLDTRSDGLHTALNFLKAKASKQDVWSIGPFLEKVVDHVWCTNKIIAGVADGILKAQTLEIINVAHNMIAHNAEMVTEVHKDLILKEISGDNRAIIERKLNKMKSYTSSPHCEMTLVTYLINNNLCSSDVIIGASKNSCLQCYISLQGVEKSKEIKIHMKGTHGKGYRNYSLPSSLDGASRECIFQIAKTNLNLKVEQPTGGHPKDGSTSSAGSTVANNLTSDEDWSPEVKLEDRGMLWPEYEI